MTSKQELRVRIMPLVLTVAAASFTLGLSACDKKPPPPGKMPSPVASDKVAINQAKDDFNRALAKAKGWQSNATLSRVYRLYSGTLSPDRPPETIFAFSSYADPNKSFQVTVAEQELKTSKPDKQPFELGFNPIKVSEWEVDPDQALEIAEETGGRQFREVHLAGYKVLVQLASVGKYPLQWYVRYDTGDGSGLRYDVYINANTAAVELNRERPN